MATTLEMTKNGNTVIIKNIEHVFLTHGVLCASTHRPNVEEELEANGFVANLHEVTNVATNKIIQIKTGVYTMIAEEQVAYSFINWQ